MYQSSCSPHRFSHRLVIHTVAHVSFADGAHSFAGDCSLSGWLWCVMQQVNCARFLESTQESWRKQSLCLCSREECRHWEKGEGDEHGEGERKEGKQILLLCWKVLLSCTKLRFILLPHKLDVELVRPLSQSESKGSGRPQDREEQKDVQNRVTVKPWKQRLSNPKRDPTENVCVCVQYAVCLYACSVVSQCWVIPGLVRQIETGFWGGQLWGRKAACSEHALKAQEGD